MLGRLLDVGLCYQPDVRLPWFSSQLEVSSVSIQSEDFWYNEQSVSRWLYIYMYIYKGWIIKLVGFPEVFPVCIYPTSRQQNVNFPMVWIKRFLPFGQLLYQDKITQSAIDLPVARREYRDSCIYKGIKAKVNANRFVQDLNSAHRVYSLRL